jgi:hypothetical protein
MTFARLRDRIGGMKKQTAQDKAVVIIWTTIIDGLADIGQALAIVNAAADETGDNEPRTESIKALSALQKFIGIAIDRQSEQSIRRLPLSSPRGNRVRQNDIQQKVPRGSPAGKVSANDSDTGDGAPRTAVIAGRTSEVTDRSSLRLRVRL